MPQHPEAVGPIATRLVRQMQKQALTAAQTPFPPATRESSRTAIGRWLTYESQATSMAIASDLGWPVDRVTTVAIGLLNVHLKEPGARARLRKLGDPA